MFMRYGGEYKFFGGTRDDGETLVQTAIRELKEECLGIPLRNERDARLILFNKKRTKVVKGRSYLMFNFVAFAEQNRWLRDLDVEDVNRRLREREQQCESLVRDGSWWTMSEKQKAAISPEVHLVKWIPLDRAVDIMFKSRAVRRRFDLSLSLSLFDIVRSSTQNVARSRHRRRRSYRSTRIKPRSSKSTEYGNVTACIKAWPR